MSDHPIESLMRTAMENIKAMVDVNTVVGDPIETPAGQVIVPITRVTCGFAAGGSEYEAGQNGRGGGGGGNSGGPAELPFGGGSGAGVSVQPVGFLVVGHDQVRLLPVEGNVMVDRIIDAAPGLMEKFQEMIGRRPKEKIERTETVIRP